MPHGRRTKPLWISTALSMLLLVLLCCLCCGVDQTKKETDPRLEKDPTNILQYIFSASVTKGGTHTARLDQCSGARPTRFSSLLSLLLLPLLCQWMSKTVCCCFATNAIPSMAPPRTWMLIPQNTQQTKTSFWFEQGVAKCLRTAVLRSEANNREIAGTDATQRRI